MNEPSRPLRQRERAEESVASILHFLRKEQQTYRRMLMMRDYASRSRDLSPDVQADFHRSAIESFLPGGDATEFGVGVRAPQADVKTVDILILTVQPVELNAAKAALGVSNPLGFHKGRPFYETAINSLAAGVRADPAELSVALTVVGESLNLHTMQAVSEISEAYRAHVWVLLGMAAGLEGHIRKGDVVFPETVWWYEPGRNMPNMFEPRPEIATRGSLNRQLFRFDSKSPKLMDRLRRAIGDIPERYRPPQLDADFLPEVSVLKDAVATGEKLLRDGRLLHELHQVNQRIVLGDQESYGFAVACRDVDWMIARGVADFGDEKKNDGWQYLATTLAAHSILAFFEEEYVPASLSAEF